MRTTRLILLAFILILAGCGGGSDDDEATAEPTLEVTEEITAEVTAEPTLPPTDVLTAEATEEATEEIAQQSAPDCSVLVDQVLTVVDELCEVTGRNQICYGNVELAVEGQTEAITFDSPGDIVSISEVQSIRMSALDLTNDVWGVALMRLQADIPDTLPGQNVTFLLFGDVQMENRNEGETSLRSFYFTTGVGDAPCREAPDSGILVQTPDGVGQVNFQVNEVEIALGSTAYLQAQPGRDLVVNVMEGQAEVEANGVTQTVEAGSRTTIELDEQGNASGEPSAPIPYTQDEIRSVDLPVNTLPEQIVIVPPAVVVEQAYTVGDAIESDLGQPGEIDVYNFTVTDADEYYFAALGEEGRIFWQLRDADKNVIFDDYEMWIYNDPGAFFLEEGDYSLRVAGQNGTEGTYNFQMWPIPEPQAFAMDVGNRVEEGVFGEGSGLLEQPGAVDVYTFSPDADRPVYFASFGEGEGATIMWTLTDPEGNVLFEDQMWHGNDMSEFDLETGAEYTITVTARGNEVGNYMFQTWYVPEAQAFDLTIGENIDPDSGEGTGEIEEPGAVDVYTFTLDEPQTLYFGGSMISDGAHLAWSLRSEDGAVIFENRGLWSGNDPGEYALDAGTYQVFVYGDQGTTGTYGIIVREALADESFEGSGLNESYVGTIDAPEQEVTYTITLPPSTSLYADSIAGGNGVNWRLQDTGGETLLFPTRSDFDLGRYDSGDTEETVEVVVFGQDGTGDYEFYLWVVPPDDFTPIEPSPAEPGSEDGIITGSITVPGEINRYPLTLAPESMIYLDTISGDSETNWQLIDGEGNVILYPTRTDFDLGLASPDASQSYELVVYSAEDGTGDYAFKVWDVPPSPSFDAVLTAPNTPVEDDATVMEGEIPTPGMVAYYNFSAEAGQTLYFEAMSGDGETRWTVNDLNGNTVLYPTRTDFDLGRHTFEQTGDYFVYVTGAEDGTGSYAFRIWEVPPDGEFPALFTPAEPLEGPESTENLNAGAITTPGEVNRYPFSAETGQTIFLESVIGNGETRWELRDEAGEVVLYPTRTDFNLGRLYIEPAEDEEAPVVVNYTVVMYGAEEQLGEYAFRLWKVPEDFPRELPLDEAVSGEIRTPGEQQHYAFTAEAGETFTFTGDDSSGDAVQWQVVNANGDVLAYLTRVQFGAFSHTFAESGEYTLIVLGEGEGVGEYAFTVTQE